MANLPIDDGKMPVFEKIGKAIERHLLSNKDLRGADEGQARLKKFMSAMTDGTPWVPTRKDDKYGLPNIIMNSRIKETWE